MKVRVCTRVSMNARVRVKVIVRNIIRVRFRN